MGAGKQHEKKLREMLWSRSASSVEESIIQRLRSLGQCSSLASIGECQESEATPSVLDVPAPKAKKTKKHKPKKLTRKRKPKKTVTKSKKQRKTFGHLKKLKAGVKKQPKTKNSKPKKTPKAEGKLKAADAQLARLDHESNRLKEKIELISQRKDTAHANKGFNHPTVKKLSRQIQTLGKLLRQVSVKRYTIRCS